MAQKKTASKPKKNIKSVTDENEMFLKAAMKNAKYKKDIEKQMAYVKTQTAKKG